MTRNTESTQPHLQYQALMTNVRARYEIINRLNLNKKSGFAELETAAFHLRKSIEGIAFGCLVALEHGLKEVPREARGQWNADNIFAKLQKQQQLAFPQSFKREDPPEGSDPIVRHHIVIKPETNLAVDEVRDIYRRSHKWLHEWNPYVERLSKDFEKNKSDLLIDTPKIWSWIVQHMITINGKVFLGILHDPADGQLRIVSAQSMNLENNNA